MTSSATLCKRLRATLMGSAARLAVLAGLLAPQSAHAAPSAADAQALAATLQGWAATWTGGLLGPTPLPLTVRPVGEAYELELSFGGRIADFGLSVADGSYLMRVRPLDDTRWAIEDARLTAPIRVILSESAKGPATMSFTVATGRQSASGVFDPSLETASRITSEIEGYQADSQTPQMASSTAMASMTTRGLWTPAGPGRVTMSGEALFRNYEVTSTPDPASDTSQPAVNMTVARMHATTRIEQVDLGAIGATVRRIFALDATVPGRTGPKADLVQRQIIRELLLLATNAASAFEVQEDWEDVAIEAGPYEGALSHLALGVSLRAPAGALEFKLPLALEGFRTGLVEDPAMIALLPRALRLTPRLSGISVAAAMQAIEANIDAKNRGTLEAETAAITEAFVRASKLELALDDVAFDVGPLMVKAEGRVRMTDPQALSGTATIRASGLDPLLRQLRANPALRMAVPVLIFVKGIAEQEDGQAVWRISGDGKTVLVNGTDLSTLKFPGQ